MVYWGDMPVAGKGTDTKVNKDRAKRVRGIGVSPSKEGSNEGISAPLVSRLGSFVTICLRLSLGFCGKPPDPAFPSPSLALIHFLAS
jgi:hypothetical protein